MQNLKIFVFVVVQGAAGRGVRHVVFWKYTNEANIQPVKVNLVVYENDLLQVKLTYTKEYRSKNTQSNGIIVDNRPKLAESSRVKFGSIRGLNYTK